MRLLILIIPLLLSALVSSAQSSAIDRALDSLNSAISRVRAVPEKLYSSRLLLEKGDSVGAESMALDILADSSSEYGARSHAAALLANIYENRADREQEYILALCTAAKADVKQGFIGSPSMLRLAVALNKYGKVNQSRAYANLSSNAARTAIDSEYESLLPELINIHRESIAANRTSNLTYILSLVFLIVVLGVVVYSWSADRLRIKAKEDDNRSLNSYAVSRDEYIVQLLNICSAYQDANASFVRTVARKIKTGQTHDILQNIESGKVASDNSEIFLMSFDKMVGNLFPNFTDELNGLLREGEQISGDENGRLTTELRIMAFLRLGVDDNDRLARFLDVARSTVYTYRTRMRSRAINRDRFEDDLRAL